MIAVAAIPAAVVALLAVPVKLPSTFANNVPVDIVKFPVLAPVKLPVAELAVKAVIFILLPNKKLAVSAKLALTALVAFDELSAFVAKLELSAKLALVTLPSKKLAVSAKLALTVLDAFEALSA